MESIGRTTLVPGRHVVLRSPQPQPPVMLLCGSKRSQPEIVKRWRGGAQQAFNICLVNNFGRRTQFLNFDWPAAATFYHLIEFSMARLMKTHFLIVYLTLTARNRHNLRVSCSHPPPRPQPSLPSVQRLQNRPEANIVYPCKQSAILPNNTKTQAFWYDC